MTPSRLRALLSRVTRCAPARRCLPRAAAGAAAGAGVLVAAAAVAVLTAPVPEFAAAREAAAHGSEALLFDRHGEPLQRLRFDQKRRALEWTRLEDVSPTLVSAIVVAEDKRFHHHPGVDPLGLASAAWDNLWRARKRGGSTLTMQLAHVLLQAQESARERHGALAKLAQIRYALALEVHWSKREILEAYLNSVPFRGELVGVNAAANGLFAKGPAGLDATEGAVMAALLRAPSASRAAVSRRACEVLRDLGRADQCERAGFVAQGLPRQPYAMPAIDYAPHLARRLLRQAGESRRVTIDGELQRHCAQALRNRLAELRERNVEDGAVVVLDNPTGEVLAYVGSSGEFSGAREVDGAAALRQPGSTLKPFLYGMAIDTGVLTAASILDDTPLSLRSEGGLYAPQNYDRDYKGAVSVRTALGSSLNVPAVRTLALVGVDRFLDALRALGFDSFKREAAHYGYSLALGGAETDLVALANAYRALANGGEWSASTFAMAPESTARAGPLRVMSAQAAFIIGDILADPAARAPTFGFASPLSTRTWSAVKTGTSKAMRDNWAVGYTDRYTVGVWVGNFSGAPMWDVSGVTGAAPVWRDIVEHLHENAPARPPTPPAGLVQRQVQYQPELEPPRAEWFIGTPQSAPAVQRIVLAAPATRARIVAPAAGTVIAPDPDIPRSRQSLLVQASVANACLRLNNAPLARCGTARVLVPLPDPGTHELELVDVKGKVLDSHSFEVRPIMPRRTSSPDAQAG